MPAAQPLGNLWSAEQWTADQKKTLVLMTEVRPGVLGPRPQKCETLRLQGIFEGGPPWLCFVGGPECPSQLFRKFHPSCHGGCVLRQRARTEYLTPGPAKSMDSMGFHVFSCISMIFLSPRVGPGGPFFSSAFAAYRDAPSPAEVSGPGRPTASVG
jgi:hypothetical protein